MIQRTDTGTGRSKWRYALALLWLAACGGAVGQPSVGGESHFLRHCGDGCGPGLECVSDVCTRACRVDRSDCSDLAEGATCTNTSIEPGALAVCDLGCRSSADCRTLGAGFTCSSGFCRGPQPTEPGPGGGGSTSGGGDAPIGGTAQPGGGTPGTGGTGGVQVPAPRCLQPFVQGTCEALFQVFAFIDGECRSAVYGGCDGNDNRFTTLEECWSVCEGRPRVAPCPAGRVEREICVECGPAGGCQTLETLCAKECDEGSAACPSPLTCVDGACQAGHCI